jgi:hypothetical protein
VLDAEATRCTGRPGSRWPRRRRGLGGLRSFGPVVLRAFRPWRALRPGRRAGRDGAGAEASRARRAVRRRRSGRGGSSKHRGVSDGMRRSRTGRTSCVPRPGAVHPRRRETGVLLAWRHERDERARRGRRLPRLKRDVPGPAPVAGEAGSRCCARACAPPTWPRRAATWLHGRARARIRGSPRSRARSRDGACRRDQRRLRPLASLRDGRQPPLPAAHRARHPGRARGASPAASAAAGEPTAVPDG